MEVNKVAVQSVVLMKLRMKVNKIYEEILLLLPNFVSGSRLMLISLSEKNHQASFIPIVFSWFCCYHGSWKSLFLYQ